MQFSKNKLNMWKQQSDMNNSIGFSYEHTSLPAHLYKFEPGLIKDRTERQAKLISANDVTRRIATYMTTHHRHYISNYLQVLFILSC